MLLFRSRGVKGALDMQYLDDSVAYVLACLSDGVGTFNAVEEFVDS